MNSLVRCNPDMCIGCRTCMIGCVVAHEGKRIFEVDPDSYTFNPRLHMVKTVKISAVVQCKHCENPACLAACASGAIYRKDNAVLIDTSKCIGCKGCVEACPFGAVNMAELDGEFQSDGAQKIVANKCDLCTGLPNGPMCVRVCPTEALKIVDEETLTASGEAKRLATAQAIAAGRD